MMRSIVILALCLITQTAFAQSIAVKSFDALMAKSVQIEQLSDSVAVILHEPTGSKTGAYLQITSDAKWATPVYDGLEFTRTKAPGEWIVFAPAAKYRVLLAEFDPETGPKYTYHDVIIGKGTTPPPPPDPPPTGDFAQLTKVAKEAADKLNDAPTRAALASAYKSALGTIAGKSYDDARVAITAARFAVLNARKGASLQVDWNSWLKTIDVELAKVAPAGDAAKYAQGIGAIVKGLE